MNIEELLATKPDTLADKQYKAVVSHVCKKLGDVSRLIKEGKLDSVDLMCRHSPAGDGMGTDVDFIDFELGDPDGDDIGYVIQLLKDLKQQMEVGQCQSK